MSTLALEEGPEDVGVGGSRLTLAVRYFDLALLAAALPVFLAADLPIAGYLVVAAVWLLATAVELYTERRVVRELKQRQPPRRHGLDRRDHAGARLDDRSGRAAGRPPGRARGRSRRRGAVAILFTVHFAGRFIARAMTPPEERI